LVSSFSDRFQLSNILIKKPYKEAVSSSWFLSTCPQPVLWRDEWKVGRNQSFLVTGVLPATLSHKYRSVVKKAYFAKPKKPRSLLGVPKGPFPGHSFHSKGTLFLLCSNLGCSSSTTNQVSVRRVDSSFLVFSLSSHRYSQISLLFNSRFIDSQ
jgi:hypothetical protein